MLTDRHRAALSSLRQVGKQTDRVDNDTWVVWVSGNDKRETSNVMEMLAFAGFMSMSAKFDRACGKTKILIKPLAKEV